MDHACISSALVHGQVGFFFDEACSDFPPCELPEDCGADYSSANDQNIHVLPMQGGVSDAGRPGAGRRRMVAITGQAIDYPPVAELCSLLPADTTPSHVRTFPSSTRAPFFSVHEISRLSLLASDRSREEAFDMRSPLTKEIESKPWACLGFADGRMKSVLV
jgi:hypothetical protein